MNNYELQQELNLLIKRFKRGQIKAEKEAREHQQRRIKSRVSSPYDKFDKEKLRMHRERMAS